MADENDHFLSISDLMSGLMMVFLLISLAYMYQTSTAMDKVTASKDKIANIALTYQKSQALLYDRLYDEFKEDMGKWGASIDRKTLSVRFHEPEVLFRTGKSDVSGKFKWILDDFFPRYINILSSSEFRDAISEIRIEGHTSSEWSGGPANAELDYFRNMELSQERTRSVLTYCFEIIKNEDMRDFMRRYLTANGLSSSKPIYDASGNEDREQSRRVEFRARTNSEERIAQIIEELINE
jgi:outer membrane protein OmpA-like peptidoglycan-associated protein